MPPHIAFGVHGLSGRQHAVFRELATGAEPAIEFVEFGFRPIGKFRLMTRDHAFDQRIGCAIELARRMSAGRPEQIVDRHAEAVRQLVKRAGVRIRCAAREAADGTLVELGGGDYVLKRETGAGHDAAQVHGDRGGILVEKRGRGQVSRSIGGEAADLGFVSKHFLQSRMPGAKRSTAPDSTHLERCPSHPFSVLRRSLKR